MLLKNNGIKQRVEVVLNYLLVMTLLNPVPKHLVIKKKISICGSGRALLKFHVWRG